MEVEYFGPDIGYIETEQYCINEFHEACSSTETVRTNDDSTGKRMYAGAHVAVRFYYKYRLWFENHVVVELGCGVGVVGSLLVHFSDVGRVVLTDGNEDSLIMATNNSRKILASNPLSHISDRLYTKHLYWIESIDSQISPHISSFLATTNNSKPFDIIIGCELMYYSTDINALLSTVYYLTGGEGLFLHVHLFRKTGQITQMIDYLRLFDWISYEVPVDRFITAEELGHHPEWYRIRAIISGPKQRVEMLKEQYAEDLWVILEEYPAEDEAVDGLPFQSL